MPPYETDWYAVSSDAPCRFCGEVGNIECRDWTSSCGGHDDWHYRCTACGKDWWIEGADA